MSVETQRSETWEVSRLVDVDFARGANHCRFKRIKPPKKLLHFNLDITSEQSIKRMTILRKSIASKGHRIKYGLDHWTLGLFDYFFGPFFGPFYCGAVEHWN